MDALDLVVVSAGACTNSAKSSMGTSSDCADAFAVDIHTGSVLMAYKGAQGNGCAPNGVTVLSNALLMAHPDRPTLTTWSLNKDQAVSRLASPEKLACLATSPDGMYIVGGALSGAIYIWYSLSGQLLRILSNAHYKKINAVQFLSTGDAFLSCSDDSTIKLWLLADALNVLTPNAQIPPFKTFTDHRLAVTSIVLSSFGWQSRLVSVSLDCTCTVYDLTDFKKLFSIRFPEELASVIFEENELHLFIGTMKGGIYKIPLYEKRDMQITNKPYHSAVSAQQHQLMQGHSAAVTCLVLIPSSIASSPALLLVSSSLDGQMIVWDTQSQQPLRLLTHQKGPISHLSVAPRKWICSQSPSTLPALRRYVQPLPLNEAVIPLDRAHTQPITLEGNKENILYDEELNELLNEWQYETGHDSKDSANLIKLKETNAALTIANNEMHQMLLKFASK